MHTFLILIKKRHDLQLLQRTGWFMTGCIFIFLQDPYLSISSYMSSHLINILLYKLYRKQQGDLGKWISKPLVTRIWAFTSFSLFTPCLPFRRANVLANGFTGEARKLIKILHLTLPGYFTLPTFSILLRDDKFSWAMLKKSGYSHFCVNLPVVPIISVISLVQF